MRTRFASLGRFPLLLLVVVAAVVAVGPADGAPSSDPLRWPDRRFAACGAVDPASGSLYAYGGRADDGITHHADLWALDMDRGARPEWHLAAPAGTPSGPPPVRSCAAAWDRNEGVLVVFGGWDGVTHDSGLRAFDPSSGTWRVLCDATSCGVGPAGRRASQLVVDEVRRRVLVFGGTNGTYFDDLWSLDLATMTWTRLASTGPVSRGGHSMVVDPGGDAVWLFGGTRPGRDLGDLWRLDLSNDTWTHVIPGCADGCPSARSGASLAADAKRLVLYGGWESATNTYRREAWLLTDLDAAPRWSPVDPASETPQARFFAVAGIDPVGGRLIVFGGGSAGSAYKDAVALTLPTVDHPASWHSLSPTTELTARDQATVVLDRGVLTTFGGFGAGTVPGTVAAGTHLADTWQRPIGGRGRWQLVTPLRIEAVPIAREGPASAMDPVRHRLVLFGGLNGDTTLADVWTTDLSRPGRPRWSQLCAPNDTASCGIGPTARWGSHAVYDPDGNRFIVFGGSTGTGTSTNDVWALDLSGQPTWHELVIEGPRPAARWSAASGFDPVRRRLVVFGGQTGPDASGGTTLHDTWALSLDGTPKWTQLAVTGPQPAPRRSPAGAVRVGRKGTQLLVAMGLTTTAGTHHRDVWSLDLGSDDATWVELAADNPPMVAPAPRRSAAGAYDRAHDRLLVAFGRDETTFNDEVWSFSLRDHTWARLPG